MNDKSLLKQKFIDYVDSIIVNKKISHAYLIELSDYEEDYNYVLSFVKMILCDTSYEKLFGSNNNLINQIDNNNYPDLKVIEPIGNSIRKSQLTDLQDDFSNTSLINGKRIYIIKNAEKLNSSSANTILKFLEEPVDNVIAILVTTNRYKIIKTILSRCQILSLKEEKLDFDYDDEFIDFLSLLLNPKNFFINYKSITESYLVDKNVALNYFGLAEKSIISFFHNKYSGDNVDKRIYDILSSKSDSYLLKYLSIIESELKKLNYNVNFKLWLDSILARLLLEVNYD